MSQSYDSAVAELRRLLLQMTPAFSPNDRHALLLPGVGTFDVRKARPIGAGADQDFALVFWVAAPKLQAVLDGDSPDDQRALKGRSFPGADLLAERVRADLLQRGTSTLPEVGTLEVISLKSRAGKSARFQMAPSLEAALNSGS